MNMILLSGIPASGKTTFYNSMFSMTHTHINLDTLKTRNREMNMVVSCLLNRQPFIIDNTNCSRTDRSKYIIKAKEFGFSIHGYYFVTKINEAIVRNRLRSGKDKVPDVAILRVNTVIEGGPYLLFEGPALA